MCRWMAYSGGRIPLEDLLFRPKHNLIDQSLAAKSRETPTNGDAPSLYYSAGAEDIYAINPAIAGHFGAKARTVVSEPVGAYAEMWTEAPQGSLLTVRDGEVAVSGFGPPA